jgi:hypothetical protein
MYVCSHPACHSCSGRDEAEAEVRVAIAWRVPAAIRWPAIAGVVVPTAAPVDPVRSPDDALQNNTVLLKPLD